MQYFIIKIIILIFLWITFNANDLLTLYISPCYNNSPMRYAKITVARKGFPPVQNQCALVQRKLTTLLAAKFIWSITKCYQGETCGFLIDLDSTNEWWLVVKHVRNFIQASSSLNIHHLASSAITSSRVYDLSLYGLFTRASENTSCIVHKCHLDYKRFEWAPNTIIIVWCGSPPRGVKLIVMR